MDQHVTDFYRQWSDNDPNGNFHVVKALHEDRSISWQEASTLVPGFTRGWLELTHISSQDRIDFTRDFWLLKLPFHPKLNPFIEQFFASLDDIGIYLVQQKAEDPYEAHMVYSLKKNRGFFRGLPPAKESEVSDLQQAFPDLIFPADFIAFQEIHNGFCKSTDTGIIPTNQIPDGYKNFQQLLTQGDPCVTTKGVAVNPSSLIPFYESFGMPFYQCFWKDWYPENEMGNVYYSGISNTISDVSCRDPAADTMAFPTFTDWLMFYLESIE